MAYFQAAPSSVMDAAPRDPLGARHTYMLACARLEDEAGFDAVCARFSRQESAWSHLSRALLLYSDPTTLCGYYIGTPSHVGGNTWRMDIVLCDYDFFRVIYHAEARAVVRNGNAVHIALLSVTGEKGSPLPRRSLDRVMENLQEIIRTGLRKGDIASRCSVSQYILMLPQANYENSRMVCDRVIRAFFRQYPHSPAQLHYSVQPLEPNI